MTQIFLHGFNIVSGFQAVHGECVSEIVEPKLGYGVGVDRVDLAAAKKRGIVVTNAPGANSTSVCELAFALMLAAARNLPKLHEAVSAGPWPRDKGVELAGRTLGIVGMGAIGKRLAVRAKAF